MSEKERSELDAKLRENGSLTRPIVPQPVKDWFTFKRIVILGTILVFAFIIGYVGKSLVDDARKLGYAEGVEKQANQSIKTYEDFVGQLTSEREEKIKLIAELEKLKAKELKVIEQRKVLNKKKTDSIKAKSTPTEVAKDVKEILGIEPEITPTGNLAFTVVEVKDWLVMKVDYDSLILDLESKTHLLALTEQENQILQERLDKTELALALANKAIKDSKEATGAYKAAAKKSFSAKLLTGIKRVGEYAIVAGATVLIMHASGN